MIAPQKGPEGLEILDTIAKATGLREGSNYGLLLRGGRVLCALPEDAETARRTLSLYQPQRRIAKAWVWLIRLATRIGAHHRILKKWRVPRSLEGTIDKVGILVGSTGHLCTRAVTVTRGATGWEVSKLAYGSNGEEILAAEAEMLVTLEGDEQVPKLLEFSTANGVSSLRMAWQGGMPWQAEDLSPLLDTLTRWTGRGNSQPLESFPEWQWIRPALSQAGMNDHMLAKLANHRVIPSIRHGDLTRPNLRMGAARQLCVHDWERGATQGIPGLDLVHFLVQDQFFRGRATPQQALSWVRNRLHEKKTAAYLASLGWAGNEDALIALNFALNTGATYIDQTVMLSTLITATDFQFRL